jgi:hypothetical protein
MQVMAFRSNGDTSNIERVFLYKDSGATAGTEGDPITGLTNASTGLNISTIANNEATANTDTSAATSSIETVTTLGTYSTPTAGFVRFREVDATNMPGLYEIQWENARYAVASSIWLDVTISGVADLAPFHGRIYLKAIPANVTEWIGTAAATPTVAGVPEVDVTHQGGGAIPAPAVTGVPDVNMTHHVDVAASVTNSELAVNVGQIIGTAPSLTTGDIDVNVSTVAAAALTSIENEILDADMTGHQTLGTLGQAIGDPVADTTTIYQATVTDATGDNVAVDVVAVKAELDKVPLSDGTNSWNATALAAINAEVDTALATTTYAEPGQGTPAATASLKDKIGYLYKAWRNRSNQTSTTYQLFNDDASTVDQKATVSDDATTAEKGEVATGP